MTVWCWRLQISESRRLRLYNAFVLPVLTYNCGTWGLKHNEIESLDAFHSRQLQHLIKVFYPITISNTELYRHCQTDPISVIAKNARWRLFGHILRLPVDTPANISMTTYFESRALHGRVGAPRTTLSVVLDRDLREACRRGTMPTNERRFGGTKTESNRQRLVQRSDRHNVASRWTQALT